MCNNGKKPLKQLKKSKIRFFFHSYLNLYCSCNKKHLILPVIEAVGHSNETKLNLRMRAKCVIIEHETSAHIQYFQKLGRFPQNI